MEEIARPAKYAHWLKEENLAQVTAWASEYAQNKDVAALMGITYTTFNEWTHRFPAFSDAIKRGRRRRAVDIQLKLHDVAMGGIVEEIYDTEERYDEASGRWIPKSRKVRRRKIPPNAAALIFEAKNRLGYTDNPKVNDTTEESKAEEFLKAWADAETE